MKDNLEKAFKNSLEEYEVAYDPKAWDAVNTQLNANAATGGGALSSAFKWVLATVLFGAVVTGSYFLWYDNEKPARTETAVVENENLPESQVEADETEQVQDEAVLVADDQEVNLAQKVESTNELVPIVKVKEKKVIENEAIQTENVVEKKIQEKKEKTKTPPVIFKEELDVNNDYVGGHLSTTAICAGEKIEIKNTSKDSKVRFEVDGNWKVLNSGSAYSYIPKESGVISFVNESDEVIVKKFITVNELPTPEFNFDANIFEQGMPVVIAEAYGDYKSYAWKFDETHNKEGVVVKHNFFDKGDYEISLKVLDVNGCESEITKTVRIRDKFNLMAVDAFKPNGSDVRNKTFMPFSLTERDVRFQLTIVDPVDNGIVFTSSDSDEAWDGTDQRTGKMTQSNKSFIWKVQILDPAENERPIYAGTVVHN